MILKDIPVTLIPLKDNEEVEETGQNYLENALIKAKTYGQKYNLITLADDSGLEIDALNGLPHIFSARYLGKILHLMKK